jgi:hypothetical protein
MKRACPNRVAQISVFTSICTAFSSFQGFIKVWLPCEMQGSIQIIASRVPVGRWRLPFEFYPSGLAGTERPSMSTCSTDLVLPTFAVCFEGSNPFESPVRIDAGVLAQIAARYDAV